MAAGQPKAGYLSIQNFRFGLDARRSELTSQPGTLLRAVDCHVTQGAELEKRKAFVKTALPANTFPGLPTLTTHLVFGSIAPPAMPGGFTYQQLTSPLGSAMTALIGATLFDGKAFVIAAFGADGTFCFYDGTLVEDYIAGLVMTGGTSDTAIAAKIAALVNLTTEYTATSALGVVSITSLPGNNFSINTTTTLTPTSTGVITPSVTFLANPATPGAGAIGSFQIQGTYDGSVTPAYGQVTDVLINGVSIINSTPVVATTIHSIDLAILVASAINLNSATNGGFNATANSNTVVIYAPLGTVYNNATFSVVSAGVTIGNYLATISGNHFTLGPITDANGVDLLQGNTYTFNQPTSAFYHTLQQIIARINSQTATTGYTAAAIGPASTTGPMILSISNAKTTVLDASMVITITNTFVSNPGGTILFPNPGGGGNPLIVTLSTGSISQSVNYGPLVTGSVSCNASNGTAPFTYKWNYVSGSSLITPLNPTAATTSFQLATYTKTQTSAVFNCTVSDSAGNVLASAPLTITFYYAV